MRSSQDSLFALVERARQKSTAYPDLWTALTDEEIEDAFTLVLEQGIRHLEKNKKNFAALGEEGLTAALAGALMFPDIVTVYQEANFNGHVDMTIELVCSDPIQIKLVEAKIYKGAKYHIQGMTQLLAYMTGREMSGLMINYVRQRDIRGITEKLRLALNEQKPENQVADCADHKMRWSLVTQHRHSSGEMLSLDHVGCNLCS